MSSGGRGRGEQKAQDGQFEETQQDPEGLLPERMARGEGLEVDEATEVTKLKCDRFQALISPVTSRTGNVNTRPLQRPTLRRNQMDVQWRIDTVTRGSLYGR